MKIKFKVLALCACSIAILPAQTATQEKPATEKVAEEPKAETPVEKQAFKVFGLLETLPEIFGSIKDDASLAQAETKLDDMFKKLKVEEAALLKLEVPDNEAREKLSAKMKIKQEAMSGKLMTTMQKVMTEMPPATQEKFGAMMMKFGEKMSEFAPSMDKYFMTDAEKAAKEGQ